MYRIAALLLILLMFSAPAEVLANSRNTNIYIYNQWNEAVPSLSGYMVYATFNGPQLGVGHLNAPTALFVDVREFIYVLDPRNNRIIVLNEYFELVKEIDSFMHSDGSETRLNGASGIFVCAKKIIYIADTVNQRVLVTDFYGNVLNEITRPVSPVIPDTMPFYPRNVVVDATGVIFVIGERMTQGSLMIDWENNFLGFFGTNPVPMTASRMWEHFRRQFMDVERRRLVTAFIPVEFSNFAIDSRGFIYTVNAYAEHVQLSEMIRKLNPEGRNILPQTERLIGDEPDWSRVSVTDPGPGQRAFVTNYVDIAVDANGFIFALDDFNGRVFQFNQDGELVFIFGGSARQAGHFMSPVAIDTLNGKILVLDSAKNNITVFEPTFFGELVNEAMILYSEGRFVDALPLWYEVIRMNANYHLAFRGIGSAYFEVGSFGRAREYFRLAGSAERYSRAKRELRNEFLRNNFHFIFFGVVFLASALIYIMGYMRRRRAWIISQGGNAAAIESISKSDFYTNMSKFRYPFHLLLHPIDGYYEMRSSNKYSFTMANIILFSWLILAVLRAGYVSMDFNPNVAWDGAVNLPRLFMSTVAMFIIAVISNWSFCTLMDGKGKFINIWITSTYALIPMILTGYIGVALTHVLVFEEFIFINYLTTMGVIWSGGLLILSLSILHEYSLIKTLVSIGLTILGMAVIAFMILLMSGVYTQVYSFVMTLIAEIGIRMR